MAPASPAVAADAQTPAREAPSPARHATGDIPCARGGVAALRFAPAEADTVSHVDVVALLQEPSVAAVVGAFAKSDALRDVFAAAEHCGLGLGSWRAVTTARSDGSAHSLSVLQADGIGDPDKLECVRAQLASAKAEPGFTLAPHEGTTELALEGGTRGIIVDRCTLVIASPAWVEPTRERIAGRGRSLLEGPLTLSLARTGEGRAAWLAVRSASASSLSIAGTRADDMVATLELHGGVAMDVSMQYPGPELARSAAAEIGRLLDGFKPMVTNLGVPKTVVDSLRVDGAGAFVNVRARGNVADLETISAVIVRIIVTGAP
ncbi:MAG: hypothetical protein K1X88_02725 [Nannocystaceae bacterium]|nr:hypothetical protein [Nannocystaceae bacterium]